MDSGATQPIPVVDICSKCSHVMSIGDWPYCPHESTARYVPFPAFEYEGQRISDLGQLRRKERDSMDRYRGGERVSPLVWRDFSQDRSNSDVNTFGRPNVPGKPTRSNIKLKRRAGE